jgi:hypothetical protein
MISPLLETQISASTSSNSAHESAASVADVHEYVVARLQFFVLQHEQADLALDAFGFTGALVTIYCCYFHWHGEAHTGTPSSNIT